MNHRPHARLLRVLRSSDLLVALVALAAVGLYTDYVKDDTLISLRYARNLANGFGFAFNPGGPPVEGYTNFAWVLLGALPQWLGLESWALPLVRIGSALGAVALSVGTLALARRVLPGASGSSALIAGLIIAALPTTAVYGASGMESTTFAALTIWSFERALGGRARSAIALGWCACLLRPEGHLLAALSGSILLWNMARRRTGSATFKVIGPAAAAAILTLGAYHAWRWRTFGDLLPNTALVKSGKGYFLFEGMNDLLDIYHLHAVPVMMVGLLFAALLLRTGRLVLFAAIALFFHAYLLYVGGDEMYWGRLLLPAFPLMAVGLARATAELAQTPALASHPRWVVGAVAALGVLVSIPNHLEIRAEVDGWLDAMDASQGQMGRDLDAALPAGSLVVYQDMGMCPWEAEHLWFFDTIGLVSRDVGLMRRDHRVVMQGGMADDQTERNQLERTFAAELRDHVFAQRPAAIAFVLTLKEQPTAASGDERWRQIDAATRGFGFSYGLTRDPRLMERYTWFADYARSDSVRLVALVRRDLAETLRR